MVQIFKGKALYLAEFCLAQFRTESLASQSGQAGIYQPQQQGNEGAHRHLDALHENIVGVAGGDAHIDDVGHNEGNHQLKYRFQYHAQTAENQMRPVLVKISGKPAQHREAASFFKRWLNASADGEEPCKSLLLEREAPVP